MNRDRLSDMSTRSYHAHDDRISTDAIVGLLVFLAGVAVGLLIEKRWQR